MTDSRRSGPSDQSHRDPGLDPISDAAIDGWDAYESDREVVDEVRRTLGALMPWGLSIVAHVVLVVFAFLLVWQTVVLPEDRPTPPAISTSEQSQMTAFPIEPVQMVEESGGMAVVPVVTVPTPPVPVQPGVGEPLPSVPNLVDGIGITGRGVGPGSGDDFGPTVIGPPVRGGPQTYVFVIDASGSMVDVLPFVVNRLKRLIAEQPADKRATIVFFSGAGVSEVPGGGGVKGLRTLTPDFKSQITEWVTLSNHRFDTGGRGSAHVQAALDRALSYRPEAIYLLSDNLTGGGQGATQHELFQADVMSVIAQHQKADASARINTIQFLYEDPLVRAGLPGTLERIARETGGQFKFLTQRDLNLR